MMSSAWLTLALFVSIGSVVVDACNNSTDCAVGEYCEQGTCVQGCNGNDTYCTSNGKGDVCGSSGQCLTRQCYDDMGCPDNERCATDYYPIWYCTQRCNDTNSICDGIVQVCDTESGVCAQIECESNEECPTDQGWYCDYFASRCYMGCDSSADPDAYCNQVMLYGMGSHFGLNFSCSGSECGGHMCSDDLECQMLYNSSYVVCDDITLDGSTVCAGMNCLNTPDMCTQYMGDLGTCNATSGGCYMGPCSNDGQCQDMYIPHFGVRYPLAYCDMQTGECEDNNCAVTGCPISEINAFVNVVYGGELGFQPSCGLDDEGDSSCFTPQPCTGDGDCDEDYFCFTLHSEDGSGMCVSSCSIAQDCEGRLWGGNGNETDAIECLAVPDRDDDAGWCNEMNDCSDDTDCRRDGERGRKCVDNYCRRVECSGEQTCVDAFGGNEFAKCGNGYCSDNECLDDSDCEAPFDSCFTDMTDMGRSYGYQCYATCEYFGNETVGETRRRLIDESDENYCSDLLGEDDGGEPIMCAKGAPGNVNLTYCDVFSVNYTSCIVPQHSCESGENCERDTGNCEDTTTSTTTSTTTTTEVESGNDTTSTTVLGGGNGAAGYTVFGIIGFVLSLVARM